MSPEQITGENVDHRTDVYAVGALAYELLSYRRAFPGTIQDGALFRILNSAPAPLEAWCPASIPRSRRSSSGRWPGSRTSDIRIWPSFARTLARSGIGWSELEPDPIRTVTPRPGNDPGGLARALAPYTPTPGKPSIDHSAGKPRFLVRQATYEPFAQRVGVGPPRAPRHRVAALSPPPARRPQRLLLPLGALAGVLVVILAAVVIWIGPWSRCRDPAPTLRRRCQPSQSPAPPAARATIPPTARRTIDERSERDSSHGTAANHGRSARAGPRHAERGARARRQGYRAQWPDRRAEARAQQMAAQARAAACRRGATEESSLGFREALAREREADLMGRTGERVQAVRSFWAAAGLYQRAAGCGARHQSIARRAAAGRAQPRAKRRTCRQRGPSGSLPPPPAPPQESLKTLPGTVEKPVAPPVPSKPDPPARRWCLRGARRPTPPSATRYAAMQTRTGAGCRGRPRRDAVAEQSGM